MSARATGYRLLGRGFDYLLHLRPAEWPILSVHLLTGAALAVGIRALLPPPASLLPFVVGVLAFVLGLNGGTLALNSAFDRDDSDIAYLRRPPPPPRGLAAFGLGLMLLGLALSMLLALPRRFLVAYAVCLVLSLLYSVPPVRLKARAGVDWLINLVGFGFLTPYAGWALTGRDVTRRGGLILLGFAALFGALYPLTQLYQLEADRARGDRTFAVALGIEKSLAIALFLASLAWSLFFRAADDSQWALDAGGLLRWGVLLLAAAAWAAVLITWFRKCARMSPAEHQAGMHYALVAWAVTDLAVLIAWTL